MSASGYKRTLLGRVSEVRFTPNTRHSEVQERFALKKRTLNVCLTPDSGRNRVWCWRSVIDPKQKSGISEVQFGQLSDAFLYIAAGCPFGGQSDALHGGEGIEGAAGKG